MICGGIPGALRLKFNLVGVGVVVCAAADAQCARCVCPLLLFWPRARQRAQLTCGRVGLGSSRARRLRANPTEEAKDELDRFSAHPNGCAPGESLSLGAAFRSLSLSLILASGHSCPHNVALHMATAFTGPNPTTQTAAAARATLEPAAAI